MNHIVYCNVVGCLRDGLYCVVEFLTFWIVVIRAFSILLHCVMPNLTSVN